MRNNSAVDEWIEIENMLQEMDSATISSLQALAAAGVSSECLKNALLDEVITKSNMENKPKKKLLDLSNYYTVPVDEDDPDGPVYIYDTGSYENETDSIIKRLQVFDYQEIIVKEDVAAALIDIDPECFMGCPNLNVIGENDVKQTAFNK